VLDTLDDITLGKSVNAVKIPMGTEENGCRFEGCKPGNCIEEIEGGEGRKKGISKTSTRFK
jgi:hypothetical protein